MPKLTAKERATLARQILAADDEEEDDKPEEAATETEEEDDDYVVYRGRKYRPEVAAEKKADDAEVEAPVEEETVKPKRKRFVT